MKVLPRGVVGLVVAAAVCLVAASYPASAWRKGQAIPSGWNVLKIGGGGFVTGYSASTDGATRVVRTDTYGDYKWNGSTSQWDQLLTYNSMGSTIAVQGNGSYVYESVVAPSDSTRVYRWYGGAVYKSTDSGATFAVTAYPTALDAQAVGYGGLSYSARLFGRNMAIDPVNPDVVISGSFVNGAHISVDAGANWTSLTSQLPPASHRGYRVNGSHSIGATTIAVNTGTAGIPAGSVVFFAESTQGYVVTTGLASGSGNIIISSGLTVGIAGGQVVRSMGGLRFAFDPTSAVTGGKTQGIYAASYGNGVYRSTDGGTTWSSIGGPVNNQHLIVASDGFVYAMDNQDNGSTTTTQRYNGTSWTTVRSSGEPSQGIAVDPNNSQRVVISGGGYLETSIDRGANWLSTSGSYWSPNCDIATNPGALFPSQRRSAANIPWLAWTNECIISVADLTFDPVVANRLWATTGIGVFYYDFTSSTSQPTAQITWIEHTKGIENLVSNTFLSPPGGTMLYFVWDRGVFRIDNPTVYPSTHGPNAICAIIHGWGADWVTASPSTIFAIFNGTGGTQCPLPYNDQSGVSTDGGLTWTEFAAKPASNPDNSGNGLGGNITATTTSNILWCPQNNNSPAISSNGGGSWTTLTSTQFPGLVTGGAENGFGFSSFLNTKYCASDRVNANTFYAYNYLLGLFRSTDNGANWVEILSNPVLLPGASAANAQLVTVPGYSGHMFFCHGNQGNGGVDFGNLYRSTNGVTATAGTQTFQAISRVSSCTSIGLGAIAPGGDYPTVYLAGFLDSTFGIWRGVGTAAQWAAGSGTGTGVTWTNLTPTMNGQPMGQFDLIKNVTGDANIYGKVYVGFSGSSAVFYQP